VGAYRECTRILGLDGYRVEQIEWGAEGSRPGMRIWLERRGIRGHTCSGCGRRTWQVRDAKLRTWQDLPWAAHRVTLIYRQRRVRCRACGIRSERISFAAPKARITRRLRQVIGLDCQSMPTSHAAVRHGVSWSKARRAERAFLAEWDRERPKRRPRHLGADEIHRGKRQKFSTVLTDLVHSEVLGLAPDRTEASLAGLLTTTLDPRQRAAVEAVCTDMHRVNHGRPSPSKCGLTRRLWWKCRKAGRKVYAKRKRARTRDPRQYAASLCSAVGRGRPGMNSGGNVHRFPSPARH
jgi:transposase